MRIRGLFSGVAIAALMTAGLASWPAAAAAGPAGPDQEKEGRFESKPSPLSLRLYGGVSRAEAADLDNGLDGYFEIFELYRAWGYGTTTGGYASPFRAGTNGGADLVLQLSRGIGIGIGAGYLRFSKSSDMTFSLESEDYRISVAPTLSAIPIRVGVFLTLPLGSRLNLTVNGGAVAYAALKLDARHRIDYPDGEGMEASVKASGGEPFPNLGYEGSLGFEIMVSRSTGFFIEALGRYARLKNFEEASASYRSSDGDSEVTDGRLYLSSHTTSDGQHWSAFTVEETPPVSGSPSITYSEPKVDLGGFSLQAGFRIRL